MSSVVTNGMDRGGVQPEKVGPTFTSSQFYSFNQNLVLMVFQVNEKGNDKTANAA